MGASAPFWRYSAASYPDLEEKTAINALVGKKSVNPVDKTDMPVGVWSYILYNSTISVLSPIFWNTSNVKYILL